MLQISTLVRKNDIYVKDGEHLVYVFIVHYFRQMCMWGGYCYSPSILWLRELFQDCLFQGLNLAVNLAFRGIIFRP